MTRPDPPEWARELDAELERLASTKPAKVLGWLAVGAWCVFIGWHLLPYALR